jgi:molybdopterin-synthase adenylyltransferase
MTPVISPRLKQTVEVLAASDGRVYLLRGGRGADLALPGEDGRVRAILAALDGRRTVEEAQAGLREQGLRLADGELGAFVEELAGHGVLEDAALDERLLSATERERFDRQLRYFGDVAEARPRAALQVALREATVAVLGLGGLGGVAACLLARCGVGALIGVDHDAVELSNLSRQLLYEEEDLGAAKVAVAERRLRAIDRELRLEARERVLRTEDDVLEAIAGAGFVVAAVDWPVGEITRAVNGACLRAGVPWIAMSQHPPLARVGPTYVPGRTGCFACQEAEHHEAFPLLGEYLAQARGTTSPAAAFAPACGLIGSLVASEVVHHLTGLGPVPTEGRALTMDLRTLETSWTAAPRRPGCPLCDAARPWGARR